MTYEQAKKILDKVRGGEGDQYCEAAINRALHVTGDLAAHERVRSQGVDQEVQAKDWRGRCRERAILVAGPQRGNRKDTGRGRFAFTGGADGERAC